MSQGNKPDVKQGSAAAALTYAGSGTGDISELLMHAALRFVNAEEELLGKLLNAAEKH